MLAWSGLILVTGWLIGKRRRTFSRGPVDWTIWAGVACIGAVTLITALVSPPNSADAMAYHMPRVVYWAQSRSVAFFPTSYLSQISLQPLAEYFILHTYLLTGSDHFANLGQWIGSIGCAIGVSLIAKSFGKWSRRGQGIAALLPTLPNGILQASGAKNDYLLAMAGCDVLFRDPVLAAARARGSAGYGRCAGPGAADESDGIPVCARDAGGHSSAAIAARGVCSGRGALLLNGPQYWRNVELSGSPLGYDSAQGDGVFRFRNDTFGWRQTVSNVLRNASGQLGARSPERNQAVYNFVLKAHAAMGIDSNDPATTWRWTAFAPPANSNHEADANNRWHLLLMAACGFVSLRRRERIWYMLAIALAFVVLCGYLKWQPFLSRLFLPLFVLGSPLVGLALEKLRPAALQAVACLFLLNNARPYLFENWVRPWKGPNSIWKTTRDRQYFNDMSQWGNRASYEGAVAAVQESGCNRVGIDISRFQLEYPFQALLRERNPGVEFVHVGVENESVRYQRAPAAVCAVLCMDCAGSPELIERYGSVGRPVQINRFMLFFASKDRASR